MKSIAFFTGTCLLFFFCSCQKFLEAKPDKKLVVPSSVQDFQALLDNTNRMNRAVPYSAESSADDYYVTTTDWKSLSITSQNLYAWGKDVFNDNALNSWSNTYITVYYANTVLDYAGAVKGTENVMGQASFFRSFAHWHLLQIFATAYSADMPSATPGIPLRLSSDLNIPTKKAGLQESYNQIIADAKQAVRLLPVTQLFNTRPSKPAAYALLARIYLSMSDYSNALLYADSALQLNNKLIDFNSLNANAAAPISQFGVEEFFYAILTGSTILGPSIAKIDSNLYRSYAANDLRKTVFFSKNTDGSYAFKGSYAGTTSQYNGLSTDEMYLIRSECNARTGNITAAMSDLNTLLTKRWKSGTFIPLIATTANEALTQILTERRKELLMRGLRWTDLRRLNKITAFAKTITRVIDNQTYSLPPGDNRYTLQIPLNVIAMTGIEQNPY